MSNNFKGITFSNQNVAPADDGAMMARALTDGIVSGCASSAAGFTYTLAPGYLIAAGRLIRHAASTGLSIAGATSGYARVKLVIDLTLPATVDDFSQVDMAVDYAASVDGFPALVQDDINGGGSTFEAELAVVELSAGGATQVVRSIAASVPRVAGVIGEPVTFGNMIILSPANYGDTLPEPGIPGRLFFKKL